MKIINSQLWSQSKIVGKNCAFSMSDRVTYMLFAFISSLYVFGKAKTL